MAWYQRTWFYIERPLPWLLISGYAALVGIILFALVLGAFWWK